LTPAEYLQQNAGNSTLQLSTWRGSLRYQAGL
jgi:hypothetical protein